MKRHSEYFVYILKCKNGALYTGYTNNLLKRIEMHSNGRGAKYLKGKGPLTLVSARLFAYYKNALNAERAIKKLPRVKKEAFIKKFPATSLKKSLYKSIFSPAAK